jgi:predicted nucleic acid-binding protein
VIVHLDTSVLIDVVTRTRPLLARYESTSAAGHRLEVSAPVLFEFLRGPRVASDVEFQRLLHPDDLVLPFAPAQAAVAADIYGRLKRARGREMDIAIAACAIEHGAALWTMNPADFRDIPGLKLYVEGDRPGRR